MHLLIYEMSGFFIICVLRERESGDKMASAPGQSL